MNRDAQEQSFRDRVATVDKSGKRIWVFPQRPRGPFFTARAWVTGLYLFLFFSLPFVKINGHPLFLFNVIERKFILFGKIFWPQDFFIFGLGMVLFIVFIALFTLVFGRIFCGWICPQTIFMEMIFRRIEYMIEGDAAAQKMLARQPWNSRKIFKKSTKWLLFWALSFIIANTFLAYVIGIDALKDIITSPVGTHLSGFAAILGFTTVFFFVYSWFREQVCTVVCPYGRMQGVLLDKNSIVVSYDHVRGEPRKKFRKNEQRTEGDCIDCMQCVKVCPTGIDIRNGTQLECINCTACIDACNKMMEAVKLPKGLIRYASEQHISEKKPFRLSGRILAYSLIMLLLLGAESWLLVTRKDIGITIMRTPGQLFQQQPENRISNLYNFKFLNKTFLEKEISLKPENFSGSIQLVGSRGLSVPGEGDISGSFFVYMHSGDVTQRKTRITIGVYEGSKKIDEVQTSFLGPFNFKP